MTTLIGRQARPNVLLVLLDDVSTFFYRHYDPVHPYRGDGVNPSNQAKDPAGTNLYAHTPFLDRMARNGVVWLDAYSQPVCSSDRMATYFGTHPSRTGLGSLVNADLDVQDVAATRDSIFRVLSANGYRTALQGKWHLTDYAGGENDANPADWARFQLDGGMDDIAATFHNLAVGPRPAGAPGDNYSYYVYRNGTIVTYQSPPGGGPGPTAEDDHRAEEFSLEIQFQDLERFVTETAGQPWFSALSTNTGHNPDNQPLPTSRVQTAEYLSSNIIPWRNHIASLEWLDNRLQAFMDGLPADERARTFVVFTSDNGGTEAILDSAAGEKTIGATLDSLRNDGVFDRFKNSAFQGGCRVPMVMCGPGIARGVRNTVVTAPIQSCDLYPTILSLCGVPIPASPDIDGVDQTPVLRGDSARVRDEVVVQRYTPNGDPRTITDDPGVNQTRYLWSLRTPFTGDVDPDLNGEFNVVGVYTGHNGTDQEFDHHLYRLRDGNGELDDPLELTRLDGIGKYATILSTIIARHDAHLAGAA